MYTIVCSPLIVVMLQIVRPVGPQDGYATVQSLSEDDLKAAKGHLAC